MKKIKLLVFIIAILISCFSSDVRALDAVSVCWWVQDCSTKLPLDTAVVYLRIWDPDLGSGEYFFHHCTTTSSGLVSYPFDVDDLQRKVRYYVRKPGYIHATGEFILNTGLDIEVCLWPIGYKAPKENAQSPAMITGIVKSDKGEPITAAIIQAAIEDSSDSLPREFSNSFGEFRWSFHPSVFGKKLQWNISKDGYLDSKGNFLIEKDQSLYVTLASVPSPAPSPPEKKKGFLKKYGPRVAVFGVWAAGVIIGAWNMHKF
ncbi:MAG: hypothetical protein KAW02_00955 [candidate division Zixibacteria bacterium]|nr:hypothetical protein [candidate division Zixibacteria bacterium]